MVSKRIASLLEEAQALTGEGARGTAHGWRGRRRTGLTSMRCLTAPPGSRSGTR
jgi:hypothetical protein